MYREYDLFTPWRVGHPQKERQHMIYEDYEFRPTENQKQNQSTQWPKNCVSALGNPWKNFQHHVLNPWDTAIVEKLQEPWFSLFSSDQTSMWTNVLCQITPSPTTSFNSRYRDEMINKYQQCINHGRWWWWFASPYHLSQHFVVVDSSFWMVDVWWCHMKHDWTLFRSSKLCPVFQFFASSSSEERSQISVTRVCPGITGEAYRSCKLRNRRWSPPAERNQGLTAGMGLNNHWPLQTPLISHEWSIGLTITIPLHKSVVMNCSVQWTSINPSIHMHPTHTFDVQNSPK